MRHMLDDWLDTQGIRPVVAGVCEDSTLLKVCGQAGRGLFPAPAAIAKDVRRQYNVVVGIVEPVVARFYLISGER